MDVPADDSVDAPLSCGMRHRLFEPADIFNRVLDLFLEIGRQRPVRQAEMAARPVEDDIRLQQQFVGAIAAEGAPARIKDVRWEESWVGQEWGSTGRDRV